jgi:hypothetical protein
MHVTACATTVQKPCVSASPYFAFSYFITCLLFLQLPLFFASMQPSPLPRRVLYSSSFCPYCLPSAFQSCFDWHF